MPLSVGDQVTVVEHDQNTREPLELGARYPAKVMKVEGLYVQLRYDNPRINSNNPDVFYAESGWRAWDGQLRWRIEET